MESSTKNLSSSINSFGLNFYKEILKEEECNIFCSGYSLFTVLSMLLVGARSSTAEEIKSTLGYQGLSDKQVEDSYHNLLRKQKSKSKGCQLDVANSVWIKQGVSVLQTFKDTVEQIYYAEEMQVPFGTKDATDQINNWVNNKTKGKIPKLFDSTLASSTRLVLVNAMYFKGIWKTRFNEEETVSEPFYLGNRKNQKQVEMMTIYDSFPYTDNKDAQFLELSYVGNDVSMIVILPKKVDGLSTLETQITEKSLNSAIKNMYSTKVDVKFPKFKASNSFDLISILESLGIKNAFGHQADFSGIDGQRDLYVSNGIQTAVIEVDEEGTVAAAVTAGVCYHASAAMEARKIYFTADHPFLYIIRHKPTGVFLFMGRIASP